MANTPYSLLTIQRVGHPIYLPFLALVVIAGAKWDDISSAFIYYSVPR